MCDSSQSLSQAETLRFVLHILSMYYSAVHGEWLLSEWHWEVNGSWNTISISTQGWLCVHVCEREREMWGERETSTTVKCKHFSGLPPGGLFNFTFIYRKTYCRAILIPICENKHKNTTWNNILRCTWAKLKACNQSSVPWRLQCPLCERVGYNEQRATSLAKYLRFFLGGGAKRTGSGVIKVKRVCLCKLSVTQWNISWPDI